MRNSYPKRPVGTHTWVEARWLPPDRAILYKDNGHTIIYCHPESLFAGNQRHVHHLVATSRAMVDGDVVAEGVMSTPFSIPGWRLSQNLIRYMQRSAEVKETQVFMVAYGIIAESLSPRDRKALQAQLQTRMAA